MLNLQVNTSETTFAVILTNLSGISITVTDENTAYLKDAFRLPASSLMQNICNLLNMHERTTSCASFMETTETDVILLCAEDEELFDSYNLTLKVLSDTETLRTFLKSL